jgi:hypothetical protein
MQCLAARFIQRNLIHLSILSALVVFLPSAGFSQKNSAENPATLIAQQRDAMAPLAFLNGVWRGPAWMVLPSGEKLTFTQTERFGPFLDGSVKVIDGRSYGSNGKLLFNAFAILSYNSAQHSYSMRSYAQGRVGDFLFTPSAQGYTWEIPAGPTTIRYSAVVKDGVLHEVGNRILPGKEPVQFFQMDVRRLRDTDWPDVGAVGPQ